MLKSAAWRLARLLAQPPVAIRTSDDPIALVAAAIPRGIGTGFGQARRLAEKINRLKAIAQAADAITQPAEAARADSGAEELEPTPQEAMAPAAVPVAASQNTIFAIGPASESLLIIAPSIEEAARMYGMGVIKFRKHCRIAGQADLSIGAGTYVLYENAEQAILSGQARRPNRSLHLKVPPLEWLKEQLAGGEKSAEQIEAAAEAAGFSGMGAIAHMRRERSIFKHRPTPNWRGQGAPPLLWSLW